MLGFKPFGIRFCDMEHVVLQYEEYESVKLVIYDGFSQDVAATKMEISRPTLTRIYNSSLKKIAQAFVEGKTIIIKGGNFEFEKHWYKCKTCFKLSDDSKSAAICIDCSSDETAELLNLNE